MGSDAKGDLVSRGRKLTAESPGSHRMGLAGYVHHAWKLFLWVLLR